MKFDKSRELQQKSHRLIPGGCHTYSKGDDQFPENAPGLMARGEGCYVWDVDGNRFIEYGMGLRAVTLGHGYKPVVEAAYRQMQLGNNYTRPAKVEVECAEALLELLPNADQVKFAKDGSTVTTAAVTLARAHTGRDMIAICRDHPFFSYNDWFIGTTEMSAGVPDAVRKLTVSFSYNNIESAQELFDRYPDRIACVILEPSRTEEPVDNFLGKLRQLCHQHGALFILDEMITGFRYHIGGGQTLYGVDPDLSCFGKALGNGFAVSALVGKREFMERGGITHDKERVFLLSTTHGAENHALAAALKVIEIYKTHDIVAALHQKGRRLADGVNRVAADLKLSDHFGAVGRACNLVYFTRDADGNPSQPFRTLFMQEIIKRGVIGPSFVVSYSHSEDDIDRTIEAVADSLQVYKKALADGVEKYLMGRSVKPVERKYC
jgi:glutamate-1-semialdehyde 2,1-aminomutase